MRRFMIAFVAAATFAAGMGTASGAAAAGAAPDERVTNVLAGTIRAGALGSASDSVNTMTTWGEFPRNVKAMATVMTTLSDGQPAYIGLAVDTNGWLWNYAVDTYSDMMGYASYNLTVARAGSGYTGVRDMVAPEPVRRASFPDDLWYVDGTPYVYLLTATGLQRAAVTSGLRLDPGKALAGTYGDIVTLAWGGRRSINGVVKDVLVATTKSGALVEIRVGASLTDVKRVVLKSTGFAGLTSLGLGYEYTFVGTYVGMTAAGVRTTWRDANVLNGSGTDITKVGTPKATGITSRLVEGNFPWAGRGVEGGTTNTPFGYAWNFDPHLVLPDGSVAELDMRLPSVPKEFVNLRTSQDAVFGVKTDGTLVRYVSPTMSGGVAKEVVLKRGWTYVRDLVASEGKYIYALSSGSITRWTISNGTLVSPVKLPGTYYDIAELGFLDQGRPTGLGAATTDKLLATTKGGGLLQISVSRTTTPTVQRQLWATSGYGGVTTISGAMFGPGAPKIAFFTLMKGRDLYQLMNRNAGGAPALVGLGAIPQNGRYNGYQGTAPQGRYY